LGLFRYQPFVSHFEWLGFSHTRYGNVCVRERD
jgi:hypothetical protein